VGKQGKGPLGAVLERTSTNKGEAAFAVSSTNNVEVRKSIKRDARAGNAPERAEMRWGSMWASRAALGHGTGWKATKM
jgi:hypothetical protein